ncbi:MAG: phosphatidylglycerophosphatase A [Candidatus Omnitrophota bacterium]
MKTVIKLVASGLYLGYSPIAPGTTGSILGVLIFLQMHEFFLLYVIACLLLVFLGFLTAGIAEKLYGIKDPRKIVIDEIAGMCLVYLGLPARLWVILTGFFIYRLLDIIKPPPAKQAEKLNGASGIMLDDIICAVYTNVILQVLIRLPLKIGS